MTTSVKFALLLSALFALCAASLLAYSVIDGAKPISRTVVRAQPLEDLPALPVIGRPGAVAPEDEFLKVEPQTAQQINASRPFVSDPYPAARPPYGNLVGADRQRAIACLATAAVYEAGGNRSDQSAVMQVILNRARHPAFPGTICGVVFQGSERSTGCQFTFTCDGSMRRRSPSAQAWRGAQGLAAAMLDGFVDERVGLATHYHTDWVVPYWSASLDKLTAVRTHLFFRWRGYWGTPPAFRRNLSAREPAVTALAGLFPEHAMATDEVVEVPVDADQAAPVAPEQVAAAGTVPGLPARPELPDIRRLDLRSEALAGRWALDALALCQGQPVCRVVGWRDPARAPSSLSRQQLSATPPDLVFIQVARDRKQQAYWDCSHWPRASSSKCLGTDVDAVKLLFD